MFGFRRQFIPPPLRDTAAVDVYARNGEIIVLPKRHTSIERRQNSEPLRIGTALRLEELGNLVRLALEDSRLDAERPDSDGFDHPLLTAMGVKSWRRVARESRHVQIQLADTSVTISPSKVEQDEKGERFILIPQLATQCPSNISDEDFGGHVYVALNLCTPWLNDTRSQPELRAAYTASTMPPITSVEVVRLDGDYFSPFQTLKSPDDTYKVLVEGAAAERIAAMWRQLPFGEARTCLPAPYGLRFFIGRDLICEGSICWHCNIIYGQHKGVPFSMWFDGEADVSQFLLGELQRVVAGL